MEVEVKVERGRDVESRRGKVVQSVGDAKANRVAESERQERLAVMGKE